MAENARTIPLPIQSNTTSSSLMLHMILASLRNHLNAASFTLRSYLLHFIQLRLNTIHSFNQSPLFTIPILIDFLQLKYQGNDHSTPFETHPRTMCVAVVSFIIYFAAYDVMQLQNFPLHRFGHQCLVWCGYLSAASLASVLLPDSVSPFVYLFFVLLSASELSYWLYRKLVMDEESGDFQTQGWRINNRFLINICRAVANSLGQQRQILPR